MTDIRAILSGAIAQLEEAGVDTPRLDAELLLAQLLEQKRAWLWTHPTEQIAPGVEQEFVRLLARRRRREPLPYLLGSWEFYGRSFTVTPDVLIPRPETELLVELVLVWARKQHASRIADIGAGSGVIAITLAAEMPSLHITAVDLSAPALEIARSNARQLGVAARITFLEGNLLQPLRAAACFPLDAIVANLPYIAEEDYPALMPEVRDYEPRAALLAREGGTALIRELIEECAELLRPRGLLAVEVGMGQAEHIASLFTSNGWDNVQIHNDYGGIPRHVTAETP